VLRPETILASNSSGLMVSDLQPGLASTPRMAIGRPFNTPHPIRQAEEVASNATASATWGSAWRRSWVKKSNRCFPPKPAVGCPQPLPRESTQSGLSANVPAMLACHADIGTEITHRPGCWF